jgi:hypothetical protein
MIQIVQANGNDLGGIGNGGEQLDIAQGCAQLGGRFFGCCFFGQLQGIVAPLQKAEHITRQLATRRFGQIDNPVTNDGAQLRRTSARLESNKFHEYS